MRSRTQPSEAEGRGALRAALLTLTLVGVVGAGCATGKVVLNEQAGPKRVRPERLEVIWHGRVDAPELLRYKPRERSSPAWDGARGWLFVGDRFGKVHALDAMGRARWTFDALGSIDAGVVLGRDRLYVASTGGVVYALDPADGKVLWQYKGTAEFATTPTLADGRLFVPSLSNTLVALDAKTGKFLWFHRGPPPGKLTIRGAAGATVAGDRVVTAFSDGSVLALSVKDGHTLWTRTFGAKGDFVDIDTTPAVVGERVFVASYGQGVYALDLKTGENAWSANAMPGAVHVARGADVLVVVAADEAAGFRLVDGKKMWEVSLPGGSPAQPLVIGNVAFIGMDEGPLYGVDVRTGLPAVAFAPGPGVAAAPAPADDGMWVFSNGGTLYRLAER